MKQNKVKTLYEVLIDNYGFKQNVIDAPKNERQQLRKDLLPSFWLRLFPIKTEKKTIKTWLVNTINENSYEVLFDDYNVILKKNGETIFDKRRFEDKEFLNLLV